MRGMSIETECTFPTADELVKDALNGDQPLDFWEQLRLADLRELRELHGYYRPEMDRR